VTEIGQCGADGGSGELAARSGSKVRGAGRGRDGRVHRGGLPQRFGDGGNGVLLGRATGNPSRLTCPNRPRPGRLSGRTSS
jgi:hypothetical protein